jgi:hypothetical protein
MHDLFKDEIKQLNTLLNSKNIFQNTMYKLRNDRNVSYFLKNLVENAVNYDSLERMDKYDFNKQLEEMHEILNMIFYTALRTYPTQGKTAEEIMEPCMIFSDHIGLAFIKQFSYFPIIQLLEQKRIKEKLIENEYSDECLKNYKDRQDKSLFGNGAYSRMPLNKTSFTDYDLKNKYIKAEKEKYISEKEDINTQINLLTSVFQKSTNLSDTQKLVGAQYWDAKATNKKESELKFQQTLEQILTSMATKK